MPLNLTFHAKSSWLAQYYLKWGWVSRVWPASSNLGPRAAPALPPFEWLLARINPSRERKERTCGKCSKLNACSTKPWNDFIPEQTT